MSVRFDHTIVHVRDKQAAAADLAWLLGLPAPRTFGPFAVVSFDNGTVLCFADDLGAPVAMHYAFLVSEDAFDEIHARMLDRRTPYWADPFGREPGEISTDNGRSLYWHDADGNVLELLTVPDLGWPTEVVHEQRKRPSSSAADRGQVATT